MPKLNEDQYAKLIEHYLAGKCTEKELLVFFGLLSSDELNELLSDRMDRDIGYILAQKKPVSKRISLWPRVAVAAALLTIVMGAVLFYFGRGNYNENQVVFEQDLPAGKNQAAIKLADGRVIQLSDTKTGLVLDAKGLSYSDGTQIKQFSDISLLDQDIELSTPRGGQYHMKLPDGTKVWMNAASSIKFPGSIATDSARMVEIRGEVYFEIAKLESEGKRVPFVVQSSDQQIEVLGTHFNVYDYRDEEGVKTTLLEGSLAVQDDKGNKAILRPGQQSLVRSGRPIALRQVDPMQEIAWKNGNFHFDEESLGNILQQVARWYDVEIIYEDNEVKTEKFVAFTTRFSTASALLNKLQQAGSAAFRIDGKRIIVTKK